VRANREVRANRSDPPTAVDAETAKEFGKSVGLTINSLSKLGRASLEELDRIGAIEMAHRMLRDPSASPAFLMLWEMGRLESSVEALVLKPRFKSLFSDEERRTAEARLKDHGYNPRD
jgi:hypothetical protein